MAKVVILTVIGVVVFVGLTILLAIMVFRKVASGKKTGVEIRQTISKTDEPEHPSKASIAAMAVGLAWLMEEGEAASARGQEAMAPVHKAGEGSWIIAGRERQMCSRGKVVHHNGEDLQNHSKWQTVHCGSRPPFRVSYCGAGRWGGVPRRSGKRGL